MEAETEKLTCKSPEAYGASEVPDREASDLPPIPRTYLGLLHCPQSVLAAYAMALAQQATGINAGVPVRRGGPVGGGVPLLLVCTKGRLEIIGGRIRLTDGGWHSTAFGYPPTAVGYPPTAVGYPPTAVWWDGGTAVTLRPPSVTARGGAGGWQVRNSVRRNVAQQNCATFCRGIFGLKPRSSLYQIHAHFLSITIQGTGNLFWRKMILL